LARRNDRGVRRGQVNLSKLREHFSRHWTATQNFNIATDHPHDSRFNSVLGRAAIENQWNAFIQLRENCRCAGGTNPAKAVGARGRNRFSKLSNDSTENRVRTLAHRHCF